MGKLVGEQLYGLRKVLATARIGVNPELKGLSVKQRLALFRVSRESKLTRVGEEIYSNTFTPYFPSLAYDRFLKGSISGGKGVPVPVVTNFAVTSQCICNCWHCSFSNRDQWDVLKKEELRTAIEQVQALGAAVIGFTGGEPLLRDDLEEILAYVDHRSMPIMFTTGWKLTRDRVKALKAAGLKIPVVSLDHHTAEVHDRGRGVPGIFAQAVKAIELFQQEGLYTAVSFVPTRALLNDKQDLWKTLDFFRSLGVNDMRLTSPILSGNLTFQPEALLTEENVKTVFEVQRKLTDTPGYPGVFAYDFFESRKHYGCTAGYNYMFIDSKGNVSPCDFTMMSFGNIRSMPLSEAWKVMNQHFQAPGPSCYATRIREQVAATGAQTWPLDRATSERILAAVPPFDVNDMPAFYRDMGCRPTGAVADKAASPTR